MFPIKFNKKIFIIEFLLFSFSLSLPTAKNSTSICTTNACMNAAKNILSYIDSSVDPCEDFFKFSCGNFIKNKVIPDESNSIDSFYEVEEKLSKNLIDLLSKPIDFRNDIQSIQNAKRLYKSCLDENTIELNGEMDFKNLLNSYYDGWPLIDNRFNANQKILDKIIRYDRLGSNQLFGFGPSPNTDNPRSLILNLDQSNGFFPKEFYDQEVLVDAYKTLMKETISMINPNVRNLDQQIGNIFQLEKELALKQLDLIESIDLNVSYYKLNEINSKIPGFDWNSFIRQVIACYPDIKLNDSELIQVNDIRYLASLSTFLRSIESNANQKRDLFNLFGWKVLYSYIEILPKKYKNAKFKFDRVYRGINSLPPRQKTCANLANGAMPIAVGRLYVEKYFDQNSKKTALEMIDNIKNEFKLIVNENKWMDEESKREVLTKVDFIGQQIGYPDYVYNNSYLDRNLYNGYNFNERSYFNNLVNIGFLTLNNSYSRLRKEIDKNEWLIPPALVNAFYSPNLNQIIFPAGILQAPFYDGNLPKYLNYGAIGSIIGHEITHGFDNSGRKYDKNGKFIPDGLPGLWTNQTISNYKNQSQCMIDQYSNYKLTQVDLNVNGELTLGENIADNGGIKESFRAYQKWVNKNGVEASLPGIPYNQNQLFFISFALPWCSKSKDEFLKLQIQTGFHSPNEFRVIGSMSNSQFFADVYKCKTNQNNNPAKKCNVW